MRLLIILTAISLPLFTLGTKGKETLQFLDGSYDLIEARCQNGEVLEMGGPIANISQRLIIKNENMQMLSLVSNKKYVPYKFNCNLTSEGEFTYEEGSRILGELEQTSCDCPNTNEQVRKRMCSRPDGSLSLGYSYYDLSNDGQTLRLTRETDDPYQQYCAKKESDLPPTFIFERTKR